MLLRQIYHDGLAQASYLIGCQATGDGYEKAINWAFDIRTEAAFVEAVLAGQPDPPPYFAQMKRVNKQGPADSWKPPLCQ